MSSSAARLAEVAERVARARASAGRPAEAVTLVAVGKFQDAAVIEPVLAAGHRVFGESRVREAEVKWPALRAHFEGTELHLIGSLQTNRAAAAVRAFDVIHSVDRVSLAARLAAAIAREGRRPRCLLQVNTGDEPRKGGCAVAAADGLIKVFRHDYGLPLVGVMCVPPAGADPAPHFRLARSVAEANGLPELSVGMSADFEIATALGATMVRIGSAVFGPRPAARPR